MRLTFMPSASGTEKSPYWLTRHWVWFLNFWMTASVHHCFRLPSLSYCRPLEKQKRVYSTWRHVSIKCISLSYDCENYKYIFSCLLLKLFAYKTNSCKIHVKNKIAWDIYALTIFKKQETWKNSYLWHYWLLQTAYQQGFYIDILVWLAFTHMTWMNICLCIIAGCWTWLYH